MNAVKSFRFLAPAILLFVLSGCAPEKMSPRRPSSLPSAGSSGTPEATPAATPSLEVSPELARKHAVFLILHPDDNASALATALEAEPRLRLTIVIPTGYFDTENHQLAASRFRVLQSSRQIEIALSLANEPNLPLIADLATAGPDVAKWGFPFEWPEDAAAQVARGSGSYQKRWGALPSGFYPPFGSASEKIIDVLRRFRLNWVLVKPSDTWGVKFFGGTAVIVPPAGPSFDETQPAAAAAEAAALAASTQPFTVIDAADWPTAEHEILFVRALAKRARTTEFETAQTFVPLLHKEYALPDGHDPFSQDFSAWIRSPFQKRAWQALSDARRVIETYKNSGHADLARLDAATEEICNAEAGSFLLALGTPAGAPALAQRNFLATIANVYRLCGVAVPNNLNTWFADRTAHKVATFATEDDRPFFVEGNQRLSWNDPKNDDNGAGTLTYPLGAPKGTFDLRQVSLSWTPTDVTVSIETAERTPETAPVQPAADVYIDVNRISEAGTTALIRQRGKGLLENDAAWEFAVSLTQKIAVLYQGLPGGERVMSVVPGGKSQAGFSATFPRTLLRGDPRKWRISVGVGAVEPGPRDEPPSFIAVLPGSSPKAFGGALGAAQPPKYIDILAPTTAMQVERLKRYQTGTASIPYAEPAE